MAMEESIGQGRSSYQSVICRAILEAAQDPETEVPSWMEKGCPTGVGSSVIAPCGIFPPTEAASAAVERSKLFATLAEGRVWSMEEHRNYKSFYTDHGILAQEEVARLEQRSYIDIHFLVINCGMLAKGCQRHRHTKLL